MEHKIKSAGNDKLQEIYCAYYNEFSLIYNSSLISPISDSLIRNGLTDLKILQIFDHNYKWAIQAVDECMLPNSAQKLMVYEETGQAVAYFRINSYVHNNVYFNGIAEICIVGPKAPKVPNTALKELYERIIGEIESYLKSTDEHMEAISFEASRVNINYIDALDSSGYSFVPSTGRKVPYTVVFEKFVKKQDLTR